VTASSDPQDEASPSVTDFTQKIQVLAGLLVAGFAGALNFIGLRSDEVSAVLRNEAHYPTLVLGLIVAGILTAVASIFVNPKRLVAQWAWRAVASVLIVPVALTVALIPIPGMTSPAEFWLALFFAGAGGLLAIAYLLGHGRQRKLLPGCSTEDSAVLAQGLLVFVAISLTATATYAGLRLETRSQLDSTSAQLSATVSESSGIASLHVGVDASKMANADRVYVSVTGLSSHVTLTAFCSGVPSIGTLTCDEAPCYVTHLKLPRSGCQSLSSGIYQPNAEGSVQQTVTIPFSDTQFQRLELLGEVCTVETSGRPCVYQQRNVTRVDIQIPSSPGSAGTGARG
jgi:hypothetical protein